MALAEEEILQARISELTHENTAIEMAKCKLESKLEEVKTDNRECEVAMSDRLTQLSDHKGTARFDKR